MSSLRAEMTHGDKAKAKTGKSSQTSAKKVSSKAAEEEREATAKSGKGEKPGQGGKADKSAGTKKPAGGEKTVAVSRKGGSPAKESGSATGSDSKGKIRLAPVTDPSGFSNALVSAAFKRALKKYPNSFRKLTD